MADSISIYNGNPTAGAMDGVLVDETNPIVDGNLQIGQEREGTPIRLAIRAINAKQRLGSYPIQVVGSTATCWALAPDNNGVPGTFQPWGGMLTLNGPITALNTIIWAKPRVLATETIPGGALEYQDLSVAFKIPTDVTDATFIDTLPVFTAGPALQPGNLQATLTAAWSHGGDGEAVTAKVILKDLNATPNTAEWNAADAFTGSATFTGLLNGTTYYGWVRLVDLTGNIVVSQMVSAVATAMNQAPSFTSGPAVSAVTKTGCGISATFSDPDADTITALYRVVARGATPNWTGAPAFTSPQAVTGLSEGTQYDAYVRIDDGNGHVVTSAAQQFTTAANVAPVFTSGAAVSGITTVQCVVTATATDADADTLSYRVAVTTSPTPPSDWAAYASRTHAQMIAGVTITGLTAGTNYYAHVRVDDLNSHLVTSTSAQFATTAAATAVLLDNGFNSGTDEANIGSPWTVDPLGTAAAAKYDSAQVWNTTAMAARLESGTTSGSAILRERTNANGQIVEVRMAVMVPNTNRVRYLAGLGPTDADIGSFFLAFGDTGNLNIYVDHTNGPAPYNVADYHIIGTYTANAWAEYRIELNWTTRRYMVSRRTTPNGAWTYLKKTGATDNWIPMRTQVDTKMHGLMFQAAHYTGQSVMWVDEVKVSTAPIVD